MQVKHLFDPLHVQLHCISILYRPQISQISHVFLMPKNDLSTSKGRGCAPTYVVFYLVSLSGVTSISINQHQSETSRINRHQSASIGIKQHQSELITTNKHQSASTNINQHYSASISTNQRQLASNSINQN